MIPVEVQKWLGEAGIAVVTYDISQDQWIARALGERYIISSLSAITIKGVLLSVNKRECWLIRVDHLETLADMAIVRRTSDPRQPATGGAP